MQLEYHWAVNQLYKYLYIKPQSDSVCMILFGKKYLRLGVKLIKTQLDFPGFSINFNTCLFCWFIVIMYIEQFGLGCSYGYFLSWETSISNTFPYFKLAWISQEKTDSLCSNSSMAACKPLDSPEYTMNQSVRVH